MKTKGVIAQKSSSHEFCHNLESLYVKDFKRLGLAKAEEAIGQETAGELDCDCLKSEAMPAAGYAYAFLVGF
jgi:hypothetical protein